MTDDLNTQIARYLDAEGLVNFDETGTTGDCFIDILPSQPDKAVAILSGQPSPGDIKLPYDNPGIKIIVRGKQDPRVPKEKAQEIYNNLHGFANGKLISTGDYIVSIQGTQSGPIRLGQDDNGRHEFSLNFDFIIKNKTKFRSDY